MRLIYQPKFEVGHEVQALTEKRNELSRLVTTLMGEYYFKFPCPSTKTGGLINDSVQRILKKCHSLKDCELLPLDRIVTADVEETARKALAISNYFFKPGKITLAKFLSSLYGNSAFSQITCAVKPENMDHAAVHDFFYQMNLLEMGAIDSEIIFEADNFKDAKKALIQLVEEYKKTMGISFRDLGISNGLPSHEMVTSPYDFSFCDSDSNTIAIERALMPAVRKKGVYYVTKALGMLAAGHEMVHLAHDKISRACIPSVSIDSSMYTQAIYGLGVEGVATFSESIFMDWMIKNQKKLGIEKEADLVRKFMASYVPIKMPQLVYLILKIKEFQEDMHKGIPEHFKTESWIETAKITRIPLFERDVFLFADMDLMSILAQLDYFFGEKRMTRISQSAKRKFNFNHNHRGLLLQALMTGTWSSGEAQQRFVIEHFLPQAERDGIIQRKDNKKRK